MRRALVATVVAAIAVLGIASPASAHNYLVSSTPAADSTISELPATFSVTTNEALLDLSGDGSGFALQVTDAAGRYYGDGCYSIVDSTLATGATLGEAGTYKLVWQVISEDGHPVSGEFTFTWAPAAGFEPTAGEDAPPVCGVTGVEPEPTVTATAAPPAQTAAPQPTTTAVPAQSAVPLADVLWIGGAILAVLVAGLVTFLVLGRRAKKED